MKFLAFVLLLACAQNSFADQMTIEREPAQAPKVYMAGESQENRQNKQWEVLVNLTGLGPSLTSTSGIIGVYHLSPDQLILIEATSGSLGLKAGTEVDTDKVGSNYDITSKSFGVHYKQFSGNSFYFRTGGDFRKIKYDYQYRSTFTPADNSDIEFSGTSFAANFQIGNQWQWDSFTLGCDWVGISVPLTHSVTQDKFISTGSYASLDRKQYDDDSKTFVEKTTLNLLRFYLGASF